MSATRVNPTCLHTPKCPTFSAPDHGAAVQVVSYPSQGWSVLCNGVVVFDDTGELMPNRAAVAPHRPETNRQFVVTR